MSVKPCSYEIQPPVDPADLRPARVHHDPDVYARMATVARQHQARRFALCRVMDTTAPNGQPGVAVEYLGWRYRDGVTATDIHGHPIGWYTSIDAAHHHLSANRSTPLWLVWLEPSHRHTAAEQAAAAFAASHEEPRMFIGAVAFLASGPADARLLTLRLVELAETFLPEVQRQGCMTASAAHGTHTLYCHQFGCVKPPMHPGDHDICEPGPPRLEPPKLGADDLDLPPEQRAAVDAARTASTEGEPS